ncbi:hypothetical protein OHAE_1337 [Ochrobactrum soli]|uniref:Uncharacterized protein n=1 Tax=Ochrobactrum soli TaxID=2448455 RepID=A0A2P9HNR2_9HYPH|nr:hypothetical protein [[Ochrobactrum] soli]MCI1002886.1 hypothetical protein [Ochrobactrum sp. C6C9]SPL65470.1 hypothetical protein OHAE_1337 [[Ochrobactrum] soli]
MWNRFAIIAATIRVSTGRSGITTEETIGGLIVAITAIIAGGRTVTTSAITIAGITGITAAGGMVRPVPIDRIRGAAAPLFSWSVVGW